MIIDIYCRGFLERYAAFVVTLHNYRERKKR